MMAVYGVREPCSRFPARAILQPSTAAARLPHSTAFPVACAKPLHSTKKRPALLRAGLFHYLVAFLRLCFQSSFTPDQTPALPRPSRLLAPASSPRKSPLRLRFPASCRSTSHC